jgi:hypothetical protein
MLFIQRNAAVVRVNASGTSGTVHTHLLDGCLGEKRSPRFPRKGGYQDARICLRVWGHVKSAVFHLTLAWY